MEFNQKVYDGVVEAVFRRSPSVQQVGFDGKSYKPGLAHMEAFDAALGHPSRAFRAIHVAGTNGKGSVCHLLASVLSAAGYKVGLYSSPHLSDFRERIKVLPGGMVPKTYAFDFLTRWEAYFSEQQLSFFEITTGLAFRWFADEGVDIAVIETGLGGLLDSTNILPPPLLTLVTNIGFDHMALLGATLPEIAAQKAGIFKAGAPALVGESCSETDPVFAEKAQMLGTSLVFADTLRPSLWHRKAEILRKMDLQADCQEKNLRTVLAALDILRDSAGIRTDAALTVEGLIHAAARTGLRGRWEKLSDRPWVICDIGHNAHALRYNFDKLRHLLAEGKADALLIVYGIMADKDLDAILPLMPSEATYFFAAPDTPRALPAEQILSRYQAFCTAQGRSAVRCYAAPSVREAVRMAAAMAKTLPAGRCPLIYIGGSTFVVSEALTLFRR